MLPSIKSILFQRNKIIEQSRKLRVEQDGDDVLFKPKSNSLELYVGEDKFDLELEYTFPKSYIERANAVVRDRSGNIVFGTGNNYTKDTLMLKLSKNQLLNISDIVVNSESIFEDSHFWIIKSNEDYFVEIGGIRKNMPLRIEINFKSFYPSFVINIMTTDTSNVINLSSLEKKSINVNIPPSLTGLAYINSKKIDLARVKTDKIPFDTVSFSKFYCNYSEIDEKINQWNSSEISISILPDQYAPVKKEYSAFENELNAVFNQKEFDELANIHLKYPEWLTKPSPLVSYPVEIRDKYPQGLIRQKYNSYLIENNTIIFDSVIPCEKVYARAITNSEEIRTDVSSFKDVKPGETRKGQTEPICKEKTIKIVNNRNTSPLIVKTDQVSKQFSETINISLSLKETNTITIKDNSGNITDQKEINKRHLRNCSKIILNDGFKLFGDEGNRL